MARSENGGARRSISGVQGQAAPPKRKSPDWRIWPQLVVAFGLAHAAKSAISSAPEFSLLMELPGFGRESGPAHLIVVVCNT